MKIHYLLFSLLCLSISLEAQSDVLETYRKVFNRFNAQQNIAYTMQLQLGATEQPVSLEMARVDDRIYVQSADNAIIRDGSVEVQIDHSLKTIDVFSLNSKVDYNRLVSVEELEKLKVQFDLQGSEYKTNQTDVKGLRFKSGQDAVHKIVIELEYDDAGNIYRAYASFTLYNEGAATYTAPKVTEAIYQNYRTLDGQLPVEVGDVVIKQQATWKLTDRYSNYQLYATK